MIIFIYNYHKFFSDFHGNQNIMALKTADKTWSHAPNGMQPISLEVYVKVFV